MALVYAEGFDVWGSFSVGGQNSISDAGRLIQTDANSAEPSFVAGTSYGRRFRLKENNNPDITFKLPAIPALSSFVMGALIQWSTHFSIPNQGFKSTIHLEDTGTGNYISFGVSAGDREFYIYNSYTDATVSVAGAITNDIEYYVEIEVTGGNANLYINNSLSATVAIGVAFTCDLWELHCWAATHSSQYHYIYWDDLYVTDFTGGDHVGRLGPISIIPMLPVSDGSYGTDMSPYPASPTTKYDKVDDHDAGGAGDTDSTFVYGAGDGVKQSFGLSPEVSFSGDALAYQLFASLSSDQTSLNVGEIFAYEGTTKEALVSGIIIPINHFSMFYSDIKLALPEGGLSQAQFEAAEFGIELSVPS